MIIICDCVGGYFDVNNRDQDFILKFDINTETWTKVGKMKLPRTSLGTSVINVKDVIQFATLCKIDSV